MISRRTLFTRLSAAFLAPLAKWLPGEGRHPSLDDGVITIFEPTTLNFTGGGSVRWSYGSECETSIIDALIAHDKAQRQRMCDESERLFWAIPQEEA